MDQKKPKIEFRKVGDLVPFARNARTHSTEQIEQLAAAISEFGFTNPVLVNSSNGILAGHGRLLAAQKLSLDSIPVIVLAHLSETQQRALVISDNKIALNAGWTIDLLREEISALQALDFSMDVIGFSVTDLDSLLGRAFLADPDDAPAPEAVAISQPGDLWLLGDHRLLCGDSTDAGSVTRLLDGAKPNLMVTDPPYGVDYDPNWRNEADRANGKPYGASAVGLVSNDDRADWRDAWGLFPGDVVYCWHAGRHASNVQLSLEAADFEIRSQIIWAKTRLIISRGNYHWQHEPCWYAVRKGARANWTGGRSQTTLWTIEHPKSETGHGTQKPVECMRRPIINNSAVGDAVYEPFSGSGTTIIAAEMERRRCYAMELAPAYVDVAVKRWETFTGKTATLSADGRSFAEVCAEREAPVPAAPKKGRRRG